MSLNSMSFIGTDVPGINAVYDEIDSVEVIVYPASRSVDYTCNALGQITQVDSIYDTTLDCARRA
jgi:hypothetical protein